MNNAQPSAGQGPDDARVKAIAARIDRPLVLVGMMGVGKSTIGRKLAQMLSLPFHDADDAIVEAAQMEIAEIFDQFGEAYFRDGERRVIARLLDGGKSVIATGGGAFVQDETREAIRKKALTIWLDSDVDTLVERVSRNDKRPLLRGGNVREKVEAMKAEREPFYSQAQIHVMSDAGPHGAAVNRILEALEKCL
ncbi:shikimate kinase [Alteraurantiacibacter aquimixticola]|uniref:Shikimate kinase n=1 Tax=Alteraurantiacibacter aquimixticola TaxID=2489173 RepID=A0A4V4U911_9SPHN|nr:shikimate kinase [Alteraurantiacibacter aquimixticola]TIX52017.1 shikimate kinase [Alteraurantiacibacter aquimixticola]